MKKRNWKKLLSLILVLMMLSTITLGVAADTIDATDQGTLDTWDLDSHGDDPVPGVLGKDDFNSLEE